MKSLREEAVVELQELESQTLLRQQKVVTPLGNGQCLVDGQTLHDFSSNDYLGYSQHRKVVAATVAAIQKFGIGARASMLVSGWSDVHQLLKEHLCEFQQTESALVFSSGYAACQGTAAAIIDAKDTIFCDRANHSSLIDGCRLSKANLRIYRHEQLEVLERELKKAPAEFRKWIVTETVFGMDGDLAPLPELFVLAEQYDAYLLCDEAHAIGVYGEAGNGLVLKLQDDGIATPEQIATRFPLRIGTLSKAFGSQGGFVVGNSDVIDLLWNRARTAMFSTALSIPACAAAAEAIELLQNDSSISLNLRNKASVLSCELSENNFIVPGEQNCPIIPVMMPDAETAISMAAQLNEKGFLVSVIRPPTVPHDSSRLRFTITANHTPQVLRDLVKAIIRCKT